MDTTKDGEEQGVKNAVIEENENCNVVIQIRGNANADADADADSSPQKWSRQNIRVKEILSQRWLDARIQILKLLDGDTTSDEKTRIVDDLMGLLEAMSKGVTLKLEPGEGVESALTWTLRSEYDGSISTSSPRITHRLPLADVNHRLFSLTDAISSVKNKMLSSRRDQQRDRINSDVDVRICREIHRNFRRILQKESRFLRDELFSARERIYRLERKYLAVTSRGSSKSSTKNNENLIVEQVAAAPGAVPASAFSQHNLAQTARIVPYYDLSTYHPVNFINLMEPAATAIVPANPSWNPMVYATDRLYYHCDPYRPIPVGYESLANGSGIVATNFAQVPPPPPPLPPPSLPPPPTQPHLQFHIDDSVNYTRNQQRRSTIEQCNVNVDLICAPSLKFIAQDDFSSDQRYQNKDEEI